MASIRSNAGSPPARGHSCPQQCNHAEAYKLPGTAIRKQFAVDKNVRAPMLSEKLACPERGGLLATCRSGFGLIIEQKTYVHQRPAS